MAIHTTFRTSLSAILVCVSLPVHGQTNETTTQCYFRNKESKENRQPCRTDRVSMCMDWTSDRNDVCQPNGLVWNPYDSDGGSNGSYWRTTCTDKTWQSEYCVQTCPSVIDSAVRMYPCADGTWCCEKTCDCNKGEGVFLKNLDTLIATSSVATSPMTSSLASTSSVYVSSPTSSPTTTASTKSTPSRAVPLGVGLGVGLAVLAVILGGMWWFFVKKRKYNSSDTSTWTPFEKAELHSEATKLESHELPSHDLQERIVSCVEIDGREKPAEIGNARLGQ